MIVVNRAHDAWPWLREDQVTLTGSLDQNTTLIQERWFHTEKWECLSIEQKYNMSWGRETYGMFHQTLTAEPGLVGVAPGNGVIT